MIRKLGAHSVLWGDRSVCKWVSYGLKNGNTLEIFVLYNICSKVQCHQLICWLLKPYVLKGGRVFHWGSCGLKQGNPLEKSHDKLLFKIQCHQLGNLLLKLVFHYLGIKWSKHDLKSWPDYSCIFIFLFKL